MHNVVEATWGLLRKTVGPKIHLTQECLCRFIFYNEGVDRDWDLF